MAKFLTNATADELGRQLNRGKRTPPPRDPTRPSNIGADGPPAPFRNIGGSTIPGYGVFEVTEWKRTYSGGPLVAQGQKVSTTFRNCFRLNGPRPVKPGDVGEYQIGPIYRALYTGAAPTIGKGYGPKVNQYELAEGQPCSTIVKGPWDTTLSILEGSFDPITDFLAKSTNTINPGASTTDYKIVAGTALGPTDAGWTTLPTIYNRTSASIANDKFFVIRLVNGIPYIEPWQC